MCTCAAESVSFLPIVTFLASPLPMMFTDARDTVALDKHDAGWLNDAVHFSSTQAESDAEILTDLGMHLVEGVEKLYVAK